MPMYPFTCDETGETIDIFAEMREAPPIGATIEREGRTFRRIPTLPMEPVIPEYRFKSVQVEPWHPAAPYHDEEGQACFTKKEEVREFCKATQDVGGAHELQWHMDGRARDGIKPILSKPADRA